MIDLHLHLDGSLNPKNILEMAKMAGVDLPYTEEAVIRTKMMVEPDCTNLGEYLEKFDLPLQLLQTTETIEYAVYELMRDLKEQGLCYAEIRYAPQLHLQKGLTQAEVVEATIRGRNKGMQDFGIPVNLILCCMRSDQNQAENMETIMVAEKYLGQGVCAVDLAGNEAAYPTESFKDVFALAKKKGVPMVIHAGEAAGPESVWQALDLGAVRIGHGIHSIEDKELMAVLKEKGIYLEMCYSSNLQTKTVDNAADYPLVPFLLEGLPVTLHTDNLTVSNTALQREYRLVQEQFSLTDEQMKAVAMRTADAAFLSEAEKEVLKEQIDRTFLEWLHQ
ncbi:MAG: adenosine deaminase [Anaerotignum sp.]|nr:adenosine deaminase [Anaerotignum sp.]